MPRALSIDLRSRIVHACQTGEWTQAEMAELYEVHLNTVEKLWRQWRTTGTVEAKPHGGGGVARLAGWHGELRRLLAERSDRSLEEMVSLAAARFHVRTSIPVMSRTLKALGLPRKKNR